jgi:prepilin-type N-terminal cleavage/methylation domain-containing protein
MKLSRTQAGFTLIELLVVMIIVGILGTLVAMTYSGVQTQDRNKERQRDINALKSQLETYYAQHSQYPTLANLNDAIWRKANFKDLPEDRLVDPRWNDKTMGCVSGGKSITVDTPTKNCYAYQVRATDGAVCDNAGAVCAQYTLTASFEGGDRYVKSSLN